MNGLPGDLEVSILRRMTPARKLEIAFGLRDLAWRLKAAGLRDQHPDLGEEEIQDRVRDAFRHAPA